ncbi:hypothetical protein HYDPIDRAFT_33777 [Hydnomerulius pinastri MD-312]|uniref:Terpene synthase n=1 Tax=Hydnomerulius pinastri MD-312 TaxID=994086 RepID=A0A0C9V0P3_9AGAM|nr:hypothetical protein HYDPIDRAFT_33777 [Hydnomerulius pinastri MD-312]
MSGASEAYGLLAFPLDVPMDAYIQPLPDLATFINNTNDVLSFYKEELNGESVNRISLLAACRPCSKGEVLLQLADVAVETHDNVLHILELHARATAPRYKLDDPDLQLESAL